MKDKNCKLVVDWLTGVNNKKVRTAFKISEEERVSFRKRARRWLHNRNIVNLSVGNKVVGGEVTDVRCITFSVQDKVPRQKLSRPIPKKLRHKSFGSLLTDVVPVACNNDLSMIGPGATCSKIDDVKGTGVIGFIGQRDQHYFAITAGHIFIVDPLYNGIKEVQVPGAAQLAKSNNIGDIHEVFCNYGSGVIDYDVASFYIRPEFHKHLSFQHVCGGSFSGIRLAETVNDREIVLFYSWSKQRLFRGIIIEAALVDENISKKIVLKGVFKIVLEKNHSVIGGDSGTVAVDLQGAIIGIVVFAGPTKAFIMPIEKVLYAVQVNPVF